jgi:hypothetical protein
MARFILCQACQTFNLNFQIMKKIFFTLMSCVLISLSAIQAQQQKKDTVGTAESRKRQNQQYDQSRQQSDRTRQDRDQAWQQESDKTQNQDAYANEGMVIIEKDELPASLRETLNDEKYAGWENGTIYHNTNTGEYVIAPRAYRFDKSGKEMEMENSARYGDTQNRRGRYTDQNMQHPNRTKESQRDAQDQDRAATSKDQPENNAQSDNQSAQSDNENNVQSDNDASSQSRQQPSSSYRSGQRDQSDRNAQSQPGQTSQYRTENMVEIQAEQVPASLRRTLSDAQYQGWEENGTLYQDPSTNEYVLVMDRTDNDSQSRSYRFDKNGKVKEDQKESSQNK